MVLLLTSRLTWTFPTSKLIETNKHLEGVQTQICSLYFLCNFLLFSFQSFFWSPLLACGRCGPSPWQRWHASHIYTPSCKQVEGMFHLLPISKCQDNKSDLARTITRLHRDAPSVLKEQPQKDRKSESMFLQRLQMCISRWIVFTTVSNKPGKDICCPVSSDTIVMKVWCLHLRSC